MQCWWENILNMAQTIHQTHTSMGLGRDIVCKNWPSETWSRIQKTCLYWFNLVTASVKLNLGPVTALLTTTPKFIVLTETKKYHSSAVCHYATRQFTTHWTNFFQYLLKYFIEWERTVNENLSEGLLTVGVMTIKHFRARYWQMIVNILLFSISNLNLLYLFVWPWGLFFGFVVF